MSERYPFFTEEEFPGKMEDTVVPWISSNLIREDIRSKDGTRLATYRAVNPAEKGSVTMIHGFCEFTGKYHEMIYTFYQMGYSVFFLELRGHGYSECHYPDNRRVYVETFDQYIEDVEAFYDNIVTRYSTSDYRILYAHSMGGAISILYLEKHPDSFTKAILSSPMLQLNFGSVKDWQVQMIVGAARRVRLDQTLTPGAREWTGEYEFEKSNCMSRNRYNYHFTLRLNDPRYRTWNSTFTWTKAAVEAIDSAIYYAKIISIPILLFQAEKDHTVLPGGQNRFAERSWNTKVVVIPGAKHEIYGGTDEIRRMYLDEIDRFIN
ncbi:MAG: alpha/beta hydrolase [Solobacterium sp.]|nr:alpha/beta hydrolase [Solobacterium sp.]